MALSAGARGDDVRVLQQQLADLGYQVAVDGIFGPQTAAALRSFQENNGVEPTGILDDATVNAIEGQFTTETFIDNPDGTSEITTSMVEPDADGIVGPQGDAGGVELTDELREFIAANYPQMLWVFDSPEMSEVADILLKAATEKWDSIRLQSALQGTDWWEATSASARQIQILKETDPAEYQRRLDAAVAQVDQIRREIGLELDDAQIEDLALDSLTLNFTAVQLRDTMIATAGQIDLGPIEAGEVGGQVVTAKQQIEDMAREYLLSPTDVNMSQWINDLVSGELTPESFREYAEAFSVSQMPWLEQFVSRGLTPRQALTPYQNQIATLLERPADQIDMMDPRFQNVLHKTENGEQRLATLPEVRMNTINEYYSEWERTNGAKQAATTLVQQIASMFGRRG